jgi:hypothetical protein
VERDRSRGCLTTNISRTGRCTIQSACRWFFCRMPTLPTSRSGAPLTFDSPIRTTYGTRCVRVARIVPPVIDRAPTRLAMS